MVSPPDERLAELVLLRPEQAVAVDRVDQRVGVEAPRRGDEPRLQLAGAASFADHEVAQQAALLAPVPGRSGPGRAPRRAPASRTSFDALGGEQAVVHRHDLVPAAGRVEAAARARRRARRRTSTRACCGSATARRRARSARARSPRACRSAPAPRAPASALISSWRSYGQHLPRRAGVVGARRDAVGRRLDDLDGARLGVGALGLADDGAHAVAGNGAGHEHDIAVTARDAVAAVGERVDRQLELVAARRAEPGRRCWTRLSGWQLALDRREHRLAVRVAALVVAHRAQLGGVQAVERAR